MLWTNIAEFLLKIPPFAIVNQNESGVHLRGGLYKRTLKPGFHPKWPIYDEIQTVQVVEQIVNLPNQSVTTKDGKPLAISGAIRYEVADAKKALLEVCDYDLLLQNLAMATLGSYISRMNFKDCGYDMLCKEVLDELSNEAENWGLDVMNFWVTDLAEHKVFRIMTHDSPVVIQSDE